jgi:signal transduction histidine kinase
MVTSPPFSRAHVERIIGGARVALAASGLLAVWLDPADPGHVADLTFWLHAVYLAYSIALALLMWRRDNVGAWPLSTHVADIGVASVFQYVTLGPSSPFFVYFVFALFSAALRWGSRGTIRTAAVVLVTFVIMGAWMSRTLGAEEFELSRFIIRMAYLIVVTVILVYLGQHEERLRDDVRRLARWPLASGHDLSASISHLLEHSASIVSATNAMLVWERDDEPWTYIACWPADGSITRHGPQELNPAVSAVLQDSTFIVPGRLSDKSDVIVSRSGVIEAWTGEPVHADAAERLGTRDIGSAPLTGDVVSGRVFFAGIANASADTVPLLEVVARELSASVKQLYSFQRAREIAIAEDRIRLARDLHDGVLQSLTGVRLELQTLATHDELHVPVEVRERLKDLERAIGGEQRELRSFIKDMKPVDGHGASMPLAVRLDDLRRRIELQWRVQVAVHVSLDDAVLPPVMHRAVPLMVHEAVVNAIRHGQPSKVEVDVRADEATLAIAVADDGRGFPFKGRKDHVALAAANTGPTSLRERVISLGGRLEIESRETGSRVELSIPLRAARG